VLELRVLGEARLAVVLKPPEDEDDLRLGEAGRPSQSAIGLQPGPASSSPGIFQGKWTPFAWAM
jgi:hypothetical protein